jgi:hypothetical protein
MVAGPTISNFSYLKNFYCVTDSKHKKINLKWGPRFDPGITGVQRTVPSCGSCIGNFQTLAHPTVGRLLGYNPTPQRQSNNVWQLFCDRFLKRPFLTVFRSFMNVANRVLWRMSIILKANKVNFLVSSVLFVFWYQSPNVLDTPRICSISWLRVNLNLKCI